MFGMPTLQVLLIACTLPIVAAFFIVHVFGESWWSGMTFFAIFFNTLIIPIKYMQFMYDTWKAGEVESPSLPRTIISMVDDKPTKASNILPPSKSGGVVYAQSMTRPKIDCFANFNQQILLQLDSGLDVDMTENYWTKRNNGATESEWVRIGGTGPTEWKNYIERGIKYGAYKRVGGQGKCVPNDRRIIKSLARGYPLPQ